MDIRFPDFIPSFNMSQVPGKRNVGPNLSALLVPPVRCGINKYWIFALCCLVK